MQDSTDRPILPDNPDYIPVVSFERLTFRSVKAKAIIGRIDRDGRIRHEDKGRNS